MKRLPGVALTEARSSPGLLLAVRSSRAPSEYLAITGPEPGGKFTTCLLKCPSDFGVTEFLSKRLSGVGSLFGRGCFLRELLSTVLRGIFLSRLLFLRRDLWRKFWRGGFVVSLAGSSVQRGLVGR